jgi:hypothetical protein
MKATIEFDLLDKDDKQYFDEMTQAKDVLSFLHEWEQKLRYWRKYAEKEPTFEEIDEAYFEMLKDADIRTW